MKPVCAALLAVLLLLPVASHGAGFTMGMAGDSLTDDYLGGTALNNVDLAALSWGQILLATRSGDIDFGGYRPVGNPWDTSIRYSGSEHNWATAGGPASNNAVLTVQGIPTPLPITTFGASYLSSQVAGLASSIASGDVSTAYVGIGSNDFFYHTHIFDVTGNATLDPLAIIDQTFVDDVAGSILAGVDTLLAAGSVDLLLGLLPAGTAGGSTQEILAGIDAVNQQLITGAALRGVPTVNPFGWQTDPTRVDGLGNVLVGSHTIAPGTAAGPSDLSPSGTGPWNAAGECATASHADHFAAEDGLHPNTIIQGLIANEIIEALNSGYGHSIAPLSDQELLAVAGLPEPGPAALLGLGVAALAFSRGQGARTRL